MTELIGFLIIGAGRPIDFLPIFKHGEYVSVLESKDHFACVSELIQRVERIQKEYPSVGLELHLFPELS